MNKAFKALCIASLAAAPAAFDGVAAPPPLRIAYNYCTLSYTFAYFSDEMWEREIDRLAAAGYNVALVLDGTQKVWQETLRELGVSGDAIRAFIPDECARAWWLMDNLSGEGGPIDGKTIDEDGERGRRIAAKMREKGIEPILQGFFGMWPNFSPEPLKAAGLRLMPQGKWLCYERPPVIDPTCPAFALAAAAWHRNLEKVYGFKPKYLAGDLFHEGGNAAGINVTAAARAVQATQQSAFPGVTWVLQGWAGNPKKELLAGLDPRYTLIEALVADMTAFVKDDASCGLSFGAFPWVWCEVLNFGGNHGLYGNLKTYARLGRAAKGVGAATFRGYGALSEGFFTNEVCSDLFEEMMMRESGAEMSDAELAAWLDDWVAKRYGTKDARLAKAWRILAATAYACPYAQQGTVENLMCAQPAWNAVRASSWGPRKGVWYDSSQLENAASLMEDAAKAHPSRALACDLYDIHRQLEANRFRALLPRIAKGDAAAAAECEKLFDAVSSRPIDEVPPPFRLEYWQDVARRRAGERGAAAWLRMVTTWNAASLGHTQLADYANREYAELLRDWYIPRWRAFFVQEAKRKNAAPPPTAAK